MSIERPDLSKEQPEIPEGVPGERDTSFERMDDDLHTELRQRYGDDDPRHALRHLDAPSRENFIQEYGSPREVISRTQQSIKERPWHRSERLAVVKNIRALQSEYNHTLQRIRDLTATQTRLENQLLGLEEGGWLKVTGWWQRARLTTEIAKIRSRLAQTEQHHLQQRKAIEKFGFKIPDDNQPYTETSFDTHTL